MGLVALWRWLAMHCRTATPSQPGQVQALFIDFPAILSLARSHDVPEEEFHAYLLREVCRIIALVNPTQLVYIGEDGCLPRAKSQTKWKRDEGVKKKAIAKAQAQKKKELEEERARKKKEREEARRKRKKRKKEEQARKKKEMEEEEDTEKEEVAAE